MKRPNSSGGLALVWKRDVNLDVINFTENHILAKVVEGDGVVWYLTCFYGWLDSNQKWKSWALLNHLSSLVQGTWLCIGDFNAILHHLKNRVVIHLHINRWITFGKLWICVACLIWGSKGILSRGIIKGQVVQILGRGWIGLWQIWSGGWNF